MEKNCTIKAVIFDFDGTFYSLKGLKRKLVWANRREILTLSALVRTRKKLRGRDFGSAQKLYEVLFRETARITKITTNAVEEWYFNRFYPRFIKILARQYRPRRYFQEILSHLLSNHIKLAVLSEYGRVVERLKALGMDPTLFEMIHSNEEMGTFKPAPRPNRLMALKLGLEPAEIVMVGDRDDLDGEAARNAGMKYMKMDKDMSWKTFMNAMAQL